MSIDNGLYNVTQAYNLGHLKIANHGFIANSRTAGLIGIDGTIATRFFVGFLFQFQF